eukprot:sb/3478711/
MLSTRNWSSEFTRQRTSHKVSLLGKTISPNHPGKSRSGSDLSAAPVSMDGQESKLVKTAYTDPYVTLSYGGTKARTSLEHEPNQELLVPDWLITSHVT